MYNFDEQPTICYKQLDNRFILVHVVICHRLHYRIHEGRVSVDMTTDVQSVSLTESKITKLTINGKSFLSGRTKKSELMCMRRDGTSSRIGAF